MLLYYGKRQKKLLDWAYSEIEKWENFIKEVERKEETKINSNTEIDDLIKATRKDLVEGLKKEIAGMELKGELESSFDKGFKSGYNDALLIVIKELDDLII